MIRAKDWSHGHSIGTGTLFGVLLSGHVWLVFAIGIGVGIALAYARQMTMWFAGAWREHSLSRRKVASPSPAVPAAIEAASTRVTYSQNWGDVPF